MARIKQDDAASPMEANNVICESGERQASWRMFKPIDGHFPTGSFMAYILLNF